jgi:hypothetical protein
MDRSPGSSERLRDVCRQPQVDLTRPKSGHEHVVSEKAPAGRCSKIPPLQTVSQATNLNRHQYYNQYSITA